MKITTRQAEVIANLSRVTTDGCRHDPMFWLGEKSVSVQVRSLLTQGLVELRDGHLVKASSPMPGLKPQTYDAGAAVRAMRELLYDSKSDH